MKIDKFFKSSRPQIVNGLFNDQKEVYEAQEVLTDFGYQKDSSNVLVLEEGADNLQADGRQADGRQGETKEKKHGFDGTIIGGVIGLITGATAGVQLAPTPSLNIFEISVVVLLWTALIMIGIMASSLIGALVGAVLGSIFTEEMIHRHGWDLNERKVLISVVARTPSDAKDIESEWEKIGGVLV